MSGRSHPPRQYCLRMEYLPRATDIAASKHTAHSSPPFFRCRGRAGPSSACFAFTLQISPRARIRLARVPTSSQRLALIRPAPFECGSTLVNSTSARSRGQRSRQRNHRNIYSGGQRSTSFIKSRDILYEMLCCRGRGTLKERPTSRRWAPRRVQLRTRRSVGSSF